MSLRNSSRSKLSNISDAIERKLEQYQLINKELSKTISKYKFEVVNLNSSLRDANLKLILERRQTLTYKHKFDVMKGFYFDHIASISKILETDLARIGDIYSDVEAEHKDKSLSSPYTADTSKKRANTSGRIGFGRVKHRSYRLTDEHMNSIDEEKEEKCSQDVVSETIEEIVVLEDDGDVDSSEGVHCECSVEIEDSEEDDASKRSDGSNRIEHCDVSKQSDESNEESEERSGESNVEEETWKSDEEAWKSDEETWESDEEAWKSSEAIEVSEGSKRSDGSEHSEQCDVSKQNVEVSEERNEKSGKSNEETWKNNAAAEESNDENQNLNRTGAVQQISRLTTTNESTIEIIDESSCSSADKDSIPTQLSDDTNNTKSFANYSQTYANKSTPLKSLKNLQWNKISVENSSLSETIENETLESRKIPNLLSSTPYRNDNSTAKPVNPITNEKLRSQSSKSGSVLSTTSRASPSVAVLSAAPEGRSTSFNTRPKRRVAPINLVEPKLNTKLRRPY